MLLRSSLLLILALQTYGQERVAIKVTNNVPLVPVHVNGRDLLFVLDTGNERSAIHSPLVTSLNMKTVANVKVLRNYRILETTAVEASTVEVGTHLFAHKILTVADMRPASRALDAEVDGILGNDILQEIVFTLNYSKPELTLNPVQADRSRGATLELHQDGEQFFAHVQLMSQATDLLVDTGANSTNLSWSAWQRLSHQWKPTTIVEGVTRAGVPTPPAFFACLPTLSLGGLTTSDQVVRIQAQVESGAFAKESFDGILGSDVLRKFEVTFDFKHSRIFLKADPAFQPDIYRYSTIGVQFARNDRGGYSVMSVWKNSPADEAGVLIGDEIKSVDGDFTDSMSTTQLSARLRGKEGTPVTLTIERDGRTSALMMHTRQMLCPGHNAGQ